MSRVVKKYIFSGFGFDVILSNAVIQNAGGEEYLDINMNELKLATAKALLQNSRSLVGSQLKFLRSFLKMSLEEVSKNIHVPASTLRLWEGRGADRTGFSLEQEKAFRIMAIGKILDDEKNRFAMNLTLAKEFLTSKAPAAIDLSDTVKSPA